MIRRTLHLAALALALAAGHALPAGAQARGAADSPAAACARAGDDDAVRPYQPALRDAFLRAFAALFPQASKPPSDQMLRAEAKYRCMDGKLLGCFIGANLPCSRLNASRDNPGAATFCRSNPNADFVPAFATGHDTVYSYRCRDGRAEVTGSTYALDRRGFAKSLWVELQ